MNVPLAERIRPTTLEGYLSQQHLVGPKGSLTSQLSTGMIPSMIFWGPPGTGKTTLANIIANESGRPFYTLSAVDSGVAAVREVIERAKKSDNLFSTKNPILFIDEIHRFSKSQQDSLLGAVEKGWITLIGATTENPSFEVIPALLSRCQVYVLESFSRDDMEALLKRALREDEILSQKKVSLNETEALIRLSGGDARKLLNILELVVLSEKDKKISITNELVMQKAQKNTVLYDKTGEQHYDIISAFIKSIRGSDPFQAVNTIGYPEARIILSQCAVYLATSPKSNASYKAIGEAQQVVRQTGDLSVPLSIRNAPTKLMKQLGYGKEYEYAHNYEGNFVPHEFLPEEIKGTTFYKPGNNPKENALKNYLKQLWKDKYDF